ncbi:DNA polymerase II large subunit [archaeon]|jgi:DNA polymerase II large subunit|nr:DNA polymerase II large subunit [archaeon]MBT3450978.1 DNA polymerase II large subunit [archaeon]MBT6868602.1 DNA polymerase II large subunit [archaeon]MBT7193134.1 DNA polymerase II large subunit [archaeon]MBT7381114.1 DNA polymerase II large subunit [archaeon]
MDIKASPEIKKYFLQLGKEVDKCYSIAEKARKKNLDPEPNVEIMLARNMAERVIGLVSMVAPQLLKTKIPERIQELEEEYGVLDWRVGFKLAEEVAKEQFCKFKDKQEAIEIGIRTGFAYLTLGIVAAPLEGFIGIEIKKRKDGKEYFALKYAGPIRGAGGTASSTSVILSDYVRVKMGYASYDPDETEVKRYTAEINDYHERITNLQYRPSEEELKFMVSHLPVEVDGDPTEKIEVSNFKDLPRISTNLIRGGVALVLAEGLCQKAPKLWKRLSKWGKDFDLEWEFMGEFIKLKEKIHAQHSGKKESKSGDNNEEVKVQPNDTFIADLVAGRPVLTHPLAEGGFRLRYGRGRTSGFSAAAAHPATLIALDKYIAIGTQLKVERPGKAATITLCDDIEPPIVKLNTGELIKLKTSEEAKKHVKNIAEIVFLGDILFNYGDFSENGQKLVPAGYCPEWWSLHLNRSILEHFDKDVNSKISDNMITKISNQLKIDINILFDCLNEPLNFIPLFEDAVSLSKLLAIPIHPEYTHYWKLMPFDDLITLLKYLKLGKIKKDDKGLRKIVLPYLLTSENKDFFEKSKRVLEFLGVQHKVVNNESIVIERIETKSMLLALNIKDQDSINNFDIPNFENSSYKNVLDYINKNILKDKNFIIKDKAGTFIGARMGRPEKAKMRSMKGKPHSLFPVGEEGGRLRCFQSSMKAGKVTSNFPLYNCSECKKETIYKICETCGNECNKKYYCRECGDLDKETCRHGNTISYKNKEIDINYYFDVALKNVKEKIYPDLIKGIKGTSNKEHLIENLSKGILRAKHNIYVNKDGTTRYDCTELPLTHFKPKEVRTSVEKLIKLGYTQDIFGNELENNNQILELKPQDLVLPGLNLLEESSATVMKNVANYVDNILKSFYGLKPYYNIKSEEDLAGHLVIGLAPHISAGTVGRIIGFSETQGLLAHPMFHAGLRRDCDGDEAAVLLLLDGLLNFSKKFLPSSRGSTMDAPLVLTATLSPAEVDDQVLGIDVMWKYPLEFYEAAEKMKAPWDVKWGPENKKIEQLADRLDTEKQYEDFGFTHNVDNFNDGILCSDYKILPSMKEKLFGQMEIARKVRAVDMDHVAQMVIQKHFLSDLKGNFRKFSMQDFRCPKCNTKYRRPPLSNKCLQCNNPKLIFTISEGSVVKYLGPSLELTDAYDFSPYLKQTIFMLKRSIDAVFGKDKDKQVGLGSFMT